jgi:nicotinic acetylcholine receptor
MTPFLTLLLFSSVLAAPKAQENRLVQDLLASYNPLFIPRENVTVPIEVGMETMLKKIVDYDYDKGILTSLVWLDFQWMDEYLQWNPSNYGGIERLQLPPSRIWTPDIFLFNDVTGHFGEDLMRDRPYLVIEANGHVRWIPPLILKTVCEHGEQEESCDLKFGSWVYTADQLDLRSNLDYMDLEGYTGSSVWELAETKVERQETVYECCPEAFVDITYTIRFHKKSKFSSKFSGKWL